MGKSGKSKQKVTYRSSKDQPPKHMARNNRDAEEQIPGAGRGYPKIRVIIEQFKKLLAAATSVKIVENLRRVKG